jgi:sugar phosphate isomerase/epimerase
MRLGLNLATIMTTPLPAALDAAGRAGFTLVELRSPAVAAYLQRATPARLASRMAEAGLAPLSLNAVEGFDLPGGRAEEDLRRQADWAAALGCPHVVVVPSRSPDGHGPDRLRRAADALARLHDIARGFGVRLAVEFLGFADSTVGTLEEAARVAEVSDQADLVLDTFHLGLRHGTVRGAAAVGRLGIVHLADLRAGVAPARAADADRCLPGQGSLGIAATLAELAAAGYDGPASVELFAPDLWGQDPVLVAARARAAALAVLPGTRAR